MTRAEIQFETFLGPVPSDRAAKRDQAVQRFLACASATACSPSAQKLFQQLWNVSGKEA